MKIAFMTIALYAIVIFYLARGSERTRKNRQRLTGRGGDFE